MREELPSTFKLVTVWLLIGTLVFLGFQAWQRQRQQTQVEVRGAQLRLQRGPDGHFHWPGSVNGQPAQFLVDTGATSTALPGALARSLGLKPLSAIDSNTAGGTARGYTARVDLVLDGGVQVRQLLVTVLPELDSPLLGMDVLSRLQFRQRAGELLIEAP